MKPKNEIIEAKSELEVDTSSTTSKFSFDIINYLKHLTHKWAAIIVFLLIWEILPTIGLVNPLFIPAPSTIAISLVDLTLSGVIPRDTAISMSRGFIGFGLALVVALPLGFLLGGFFKNFEKFIDPLLQALGQVTPFGLFHAAIIFLGIGELSLIAAIFWATHWPVLFNTVSGIKNVDPEIIKEARVIGLGKLQIFWKVLLPASLPAIFTGIRVGTVFTFLMLIGAEMMAGPGSGLGFMIMQAQMYTLIPRMWAGIVTVALLGIIINYTLLKLEKYFTSWNRNTTF